MAICVIAVVGVAPCQCFSPGENQIMSPGRISSTGPPQRCARPQPAVTISVWPSGWLCHAVRAPGSNVTLAPTARAGSGAWNRGSMRTVPVKYSTCPLPEGCEPLLLMSIVSKSSAMPAKIERPMLNLEVLYNVNPNHLHAQIVRGATGQARDPHPSPPPPLAPIIHDCCLP